MEKFKISKTKKPFYKRAWFIVIIAFIIIGVILSPSEEERESAEQAKAAEVAKVLEAAKVAKAKKATAKPTPMTAAPKDLKSEIQKITFDNIGKTTNMKKDRIVELDVTDLESGNKSVYLKLNASENFTNNMTKKAMWMESIKILEPISKLEKVDGVIIHWLFPLVDQYGNEKDSQVMMFSIERETLDKINWDDFLTDNLQNVVSDYYEHPAFNE